MFHNSRVALGALALTTALASVPAAVTHAQKTVTLTLAGYSVVSPVYNDLVPLFEKYWLAKTGETVTFNLSFGGSGAQSRAVVSGLEADVVALSLEPDITRIQTAKLITHDWKANDNKGIVTTSVVVLVTRQGNPKGIADWADLGKPGVQILTPDPGTSGGAKWNILAAYGAAKRGYIAGYDKSDAGSLKYLGDLFKNVTSFDKDGQTSFTNFLNGVGDVAITYEDEALDELHIETGLTVNTSQATPAVTAAPTAAATVAVPAETAVASSVVSGAQIAIVYPTSTIQIDNPVAVVDSYVDKHSTRTEAEGFLTYLWTPEAQAVFAKHGFRPVDKTTAADPNIVKEFPPIKDLFTINDFGGWTTTDPALFGTKGTVTAALAAIKG